MILTMMEIKKVFIAGAGLMGSGIAQVCAQAGLEVILSDIGPEVLGKGDQEYCLERREAD